MWVGMKQVYYDIQIFGSINNSKFTVKLLEVYFNHVFSQIFEFAWRSWNFAWNSNMFLCFLQNGLISSANLFIRIFAHSNDYLYYQ